jgi:hypothetical protein
MGRSENARLAVYLDVWHRLEERHHRRLGLLVPLGGLWLKGWANLCMSESVGLSALAGVVAAGTEGVMVEGSGDLSIGEGPGAGGAEAGELECWVWDQQLQESINILQLRSFSKAFRLCQHTTTLLLRLPRPTMSYCPLFPCLHHLPIPFFWCRACLCPLLTLLVHLVINVFPLFPLRPNPTLGPTLRLLLFFLQPHPHHLSILSTVFPSPTPSKLSPLLPFSLLQSQRLVSKLKQAWRGRNGTRRVRRSCR